MQTDQTFDSSTPKIKEIFQRLFRMRHRFRVDVPDNIESLKKRLEKTSSKNPVENVSDFNLIYTLGGAIGRQVEPLSMGDLSRQLNVPLSTATRIVDWMVNNDYAQRLPDPDDRRIVRVALTETGRTMYTEIDNFFMERIERLMHAITAEERVTFENLIEKIVSSMEQEY